MHEGDKDHLRTLRRIANHGKTFKCESCDKYFENNHNLQFHLQSDKHRRKLQK